MTEPEPAEPDTPPQHDDPDGPTKGWDAAEVDDGEYVGDEETTALPDADPAGDAE